MGYESWLHLSYYPQSVALSKMMVEHLRDQVHCLKTTDGILMLITRRLFVLTVISSSDTMRANDAAMRPPEEDQWMLEGLQTVLAYYRSADESICKAEHVYVIG